MRTTVSPSTITLVPVGNAAGASWSHWSLISKVGFSESPSAALSCSTVQPI